MNDNDVDESALQIVPFSLFNPYTETLKLDCRLFQFGSKLIKVQQHWQPGGRGGTDIGFGASVYDCSIVLSYFLCDIADEINGRSVIELGCGPGLASLVCKYVLQPRLIVATDGDVGSVGLTNYNILLNTDGGTSADSPDNEPINQQEAALEGVVEKSASPPAQVVRPVAPLSETNNIMPVAPLSETNNIMPLQLYWGDTEHVAQALDLLVHPALVAPIAANPIPPPGQLDEAAANVTPGDHDSSPRNGYDVVFMSDIVALVYTDAFDSLLTTMKQLCKATTVLYLVYKRRHSSEAQFFEKLAESKAFEVVKLARSTIHGDFRHLPIFIYRLRPLFL